MSSITMMSRIGSPLREIACPDLFKRVWPPRLRQLLFLVHSTLFAILVLRFLPREESTLFYTRDLSIATALALTGRPFFLELHTLPEREPGPRWVRMLGRRAEGVVVTTKGLASELTELGLPSDRLKVAPNAVDARKLDRHLDRHEAREGLDLDRLQPVAAYVGHLYPWKGVDTTIGLRARIAGDFVSPRGRHTKRHRTCARSSRAVCSWQRPCRGACRAVPCERIPRGG